MGKVRTVILMEINIQENGRMGKNMGKGLTLSRLEQIMKGNGRMGKNMGKAHFLGPMGTSI